MSRGMELLGELNRIGGGSGGIIQARVDEYSLNPVLDQRGLLLEGQVYRRGYSEVVSRCPDFIVTNDRLQAFSEVLKNLQGGKGYLPDPGFSEGFQLSETPAGLVIEFAVSYQGGQDNFRFHYDDSPQELAELIDDHLAERGISSGLSLEELQQAEQEHQSQIDPDIKPEPEWY